MSRHNANSASISFHKGVKDDSASEDEMEEEEAPTLRKRCISKLFCHMGPYLISLQVITLLAVGVAAYHEFVIENQNVAIEHQNAELFKDVKHIVRVRRHNTRQLSNILSRINPDEDSPHTRELRQSCDEVHCAVPCIKGRVSGFGDFMQKALTAATPIINRIPFLPKMVSEVLGPALALVKTITGSAYGTSSNGFCAKILADRKSMKTYRKDDLKTKLKALEYQAHSPYQGEERRKRQAADVPEDEMDAGDMAAHLAGLYHVNYDENSSDDAALDEVLTAIFAGIE